MKKIILICLICFIAIGSAMAVDSSGWKNETVNGHVFKIPPQYNGGHTNEDSYVIESWNVFAILCVDTYLANNYGFEASEYGPGEDLTIGDHPARYFVGYNQYEKTDLSRIYFPVGNSIYCISWQGSNMTEDVREMILSSDSPTMSTESFHSKLEAALSQYLAEEEADKHAYIPEYKPTHHRHYGILRHFYY